MAAVKLGAKVPKVTIPATDGDFRVGAGEKENLVVYFYPRDSTPGCTTEGILGISTDTLESHRRIREKMKFPFDNVWQKDDGNRAQHLFH